MLAPIRTLISLAFLAAVVWFSFTVELGGRTLAQHIHRIGQTPEARDLVEGTRSRVDPMLEDARDRVLGEHVEAPTSAPAPAVESPPDAAVPARTVRVRVSSEDTAKLPGR